MKIRLIPAISLLVLVTVSIWAQRGSQNAGAPAAAPMITASEVEAMIAKQPADKNSLGQEMLKLGPYNVNMEHRVMGQAAAVHEKEAELFYGDSRDERLREHVHRGDAGGCEAG